MRHQLAKAIALASKAFEKHLDKAGQPYILHCIRVMNAVAPDVDRMTIAILHDIVEDTDISISDLIRMGFPTKITQAVDLLTKKKEFLYEEYIVGIEMNADARAVKLADLKDNMDATRLKSDLSGSDMERMRKYHKAYIYLQKTI